MHRSTLVELQQRQVVRTFNAPHGEWAELLVQCAYGGEPAPSNAKGWDVDAGGRRLQVKSTAAVKTGTFSAIRSEEFDAVVFVRFSAIDLMVKWAREVDQVDVLAAGVALGVPER